MLRAGVSLPALMKLLGHHNANMTLLWVEELGTSGAPKQKIWFGGVDAKWMPERPAMARPMLIC